MSSTDDLRTELDRLEVEDLTRVAAWCRATTAHLGGAGAVFAVVERLALEVRRERIAKNTEAAFLVESAFDDIEEGEQVDDVNGEIERLIAEGWREDVVKPVDDDE